jgi:hypothetical protein
VVIINNDTRFKGALRTGAYVKIEGILTLDIAIMAHEIKTDNSRKDRH